MFRVERAAELEISAHSVCDFHENETKVSVGAALGVVNNTLPMSILEYELIAQSTLLSRGDSGGGSILRLREAWQRHWK